MIEILSFDEAIKESEIHEGKRHVLLGNGFSIACRPESFRYGALLDEAEFDGHPKWFRKLFKSLDTTDFEHVIGQLEAAAKLCTLYETGVSPIAKRMKTDAHAIREGLAKVLAARHPDLPSDLGDEEYQCARTFLSNFERIYSLNYDMLLYWTLMQDELEQETVPRNDGFGSSSGSAPYVIWRPYIDFRQQRVFYLHGGLHLYDSGVEITKITWSRTRLPLVDQIRDALREGRFPLIVTEGKSKRKVARILHNAYLNHAIRSFSNIGGLLYSCMVCHSPTTTNISCNGSSTVRSARFL